MNSRKVKTWTWIHKWSSLVCTVFMLLLCLTGLPLIFHHEIGHLLGTEVEAPELPKDTPRASLDKVMQVAQALHPAKVPMFASHEIDDDRFWYITLGDTPTSSVKRVLKVPSDEQPTVKHTSVTLRSPRRSSDIARSMRRVMR